MDVELAAQFLGIEVKQMDDRIFIPQKRYAKRNSQKYFKRENCMHISTHIDCDIKLPKDNNGVLMDPTLFESLIGNL